MAGVLKLEPYDVEKLKKRPKKKHIKGYVKRNTKAIVEEFADSEYDCCKVCTCKDNMEAHMDSANIRDAIKRCGYENKIKIVVRHTELFLVKKNAWEKLGKEYKEVEE